MTEVADSVPRGSVQPRVSVLERVAATLDNSGRSRAELPIGYSHRALACIVYSTDDPTRAQLSAVRRAVAKLVAAGRAVRDDERFPAAWRVEGPIAGHLRGTSVTRNPWGKSFHRVPTEADREAREEYLNNPETRARMARIGLLLA